jgi:hypothetical protein
MQKARIAAAALLAACVASPPAAAMPDSRNATPRILSVEAEWEGRSVRVEVVGRDRDDVVRGSEVSWGDDQPAQGLSSCTIGSDRAERRRRGRKERFVQSYAYPAAGVYTITVRVTSGGCGERPMQRSRPRTLTVEIG